MKNNLKKQGIIKYILDLISSREISEKEIIPSEIALSIKFGVSRSTARIALKTLVDAGYIDAIKGSGYRVASIKNHTTLKTISQIYGTNQANVHIIEDPKAIPLTNDLINHTDLYNKNFDINKVFAFEKQYFKEGKIIISQITFFNKKIVKKISPSDIEKSIFKFLVSQNIFPTKAKEWMYTIDDDYFFNFAKAVGWNNKPFPITLSLLQTKDDWIEFTLRFIAPHEIKFSKSRQLFI